MRHDHYARDGHLFDADNTDLRQDLICRYHGNYERVRLAPQWRKSLVASRIRREILDEQKRHISKYGLEKLVDPTIDYNCMANLFGIRDIWILGKDVEGVLRDAGFRKRGHDESPCKGDYALYYIGRNSEPVHGAIVDGVGPSRRGDPVVTVISKWGDLGAYRHNAERVFNYYGRVGKYYRPPSLMPDWSNYFDRKPIGSSSGD